MIKRILLILLIMLLSSCDKIEICKIEEDKTNNYIYDYAIIIGVDGAGNFYKDIETPYLNEIIRNHFLTYNAYDNTPSKSAQGWGSLLHGVKPDKHSLTNSHVKENKYLLDSPYPSIFKVINAHNPEANLASFVHWEPINYGIIEDGINVYKDSKETDFEVKNAVCDYLSTNIPTVLFVQFDEADEAGHEYGYQSDKQYEKLNEIEEYIYAIFESYRQKDILDKTLFIITADHGGYKDNHGGEKPVEREIILGIYGMTINNSIESDIEIEDIAAITLYALGYEIPDTYSGIVPKNLFKN